MGELKSILLHVDAAGNVGERVQLARRVAQAHGARIDALYAVLPAVLQYPFAFAGDAQAAALLMNYEGEQRERAKVAFERACKGPGSAVTAVWNETPDEPIHAFTEHAWAADLLVLAQHDPSPKAYPGVPADFAAAVLIESGKPGLVMPFIGAGASAALPFLQRAQQVHLAVWDEGADSGEAHATAAIEAYLMHHGIAHRLHRGGRPTRDLGEMLLSLAADVQADLLVMGCYGHGRARESVLGGVTRTVMRSMTLPVLMTH
jgi:nucleotide-binding universal stress UspA family protein